MNFELRMTRLVAHKQANVQMVGLEKCTSVKHVEDAFQKVQLRGGEGLMLRKNTQYKSGRTTDILKYKKIDSMEGKVIGYTKGTGHFASSAFVGSMRLVNRDGHEFN